MCDNCTIRLLQFCEFYLRAEEAVVWNSTGVRYCTATLQCIYCWLSQHCLANYITRRWLHNHRIVLLCSFCGSRRVSSCRRSCLKGRWQKLVNSLPKTHPPLFTSDNHKSLINPSITLRNALPTLEIYIDIMGVHLDPHLTFNEKYCYSSILQTQKSESSG